MYLQTPFPKEDENEMMTSFSRSNKYSLELVWYRFSGQPLAIVLLVVVALGSLLVAATAVELLSQQVVALVLQLQFLPLATEYRTSPLAFGRECHLSVIPEHAGNASGSEE